MGFTYSNVQHVMTGGKKIARKVKITGAKGYKSVTVKKHGKTHHAKRVPLTKHEIHHIKNGKFIPGLFNGMHKTQKRR
jgi:hypothetical protein